MELTLNSIKEITRSQVAKFPDLEYSVWQSQKSASIYVYVYLDKTYVSLRISDHQNKNTPHHNEELIVGREFKTDKFKAIIKKMCYSVRMKRVRFLCDTVGNTQDKQCNSKNKNDKEEKA